MALQNIQTLSMSVMEIDLLLLFIDKNCSALIHDRMSSSVFTASFVSADLSI